MEVALIGADSPLGQALQKTFETSGRHSVQALTLASSRFKSERQAKKAVRRGKPHVVVDLRISALFGAGEGVQAPDIERCHWLAKACEHSGMLYLLLSRDRVFSGKVQRPLRETDSCDAEDDTGLALIEAERRIGEAAPSACILRTGPLFSGLGDNLLSATLDTLREARHATFDDADQFCPSSVDDVARVIGAILDQFSVGAEAAGIFHYCSADRTTRFGFAEVLLAAAGQFADLGDVALTALSNGGSGAGSSDGSGEGTSEGTRRSRTLECGAVRDRFAIKQVPWRGLVGDSVKRYFSERA